MNTPIGKANELPKHFKEGSNNKALIKYENYDDYLCFWRCLAYNRTKPDEERNIKIEMKKIFKDYYGIKLDIAPQNGTPPLSPETSRTPRARCRLAEISW